MLSAYESKQELRAQISTVDAEIACLRSELSNATSNKRDNPDSPPRENKTKKRRAMSAAPGDDSADPAGAAVAEAIPVEVGPFLRTLVRELQTSQSNVRWNADGTSFYVDVPPGPPHPHFHPLRTRTRTRTPTHTRTAPAPAPAPTCTPAPAPASAGQLKFTYDGDTKVVESFRKQLRNWRFKTEGNFCYYNPFFHRDKRHLLAQIKRLDTNKVLPLCFSFPYPDSPQIPPLLSPPPHAPPPTTPLRDSERSASSTPGARRGRRGAHRSNAAAASTR